ncbi:MAG TPA: peptidase T [Ignavibacteria bacterium]|nr:peptidase T [Ignavibacteria bacterium]
MKQDILERFFRYIKIDTKSDESSESFPSTKKQFDLLNLLKAELTALGLKAEIDEHGYVMATLPANTDKKIPVLGFVAHVDTSPDMSGENVNPQVWKNYDGGSIVINKELNLVLSPELFPEMLEYKGDTIITTDGTTLLGADDKAGITEIMTAVKYLVEHPELKHGEIKIGFTPDEEIGRGVDFFDVKKFGAEFAYTMDGGGVGELEYENFNAAKLTVSVQGRNVHPGYAKDKMLNSMLIAMEYNALLPVNMRPEYTEHYDGFFHLISMNGTVENSTITYIVRDHDRAKFETKKKTAVECADFLNKRYGESVVKAELKDQYFNMREKVEPVYHIVEIAEKAMVELGIEPKVVPIRGGTDGARLSFMGLPCPNIFAGGLNFHGKFEYVPLESMEKATKVILKVIELYTQRKW